ncbi:MAG: hypothetical protein ACFCUM_16285 [Bacteroidales bacterium]
MEGFIESFIYLLITIVILVLSMKKKKQVNLPESEEEDRPGDPFSDLFRDEPEVEEVDSEYRPATVSGRSGGTAEEYTTWMTDEPAQEQMEAEETNPWMTETEAKKMVMDADAVLKEASENNPIADMEGQIDDAYHIGISDDSLIKFDLKKAVIYSEIIERRVF